MTDKLSNGQVSLRKYLTDLYDEKLNTIRQRMISADLALVTAREELLRRMEGFPEEYAKKAEMQSTALLVKELKDRDLKDIKTTIEYNSINKLSKTDYEFAHKMLVDKFDAVERRLQQVELIKAEVTATITSEVTSKAWTLGIVITIAIVFLELALKWGVGLK